MTLKVSIDLKTYLLMLMMRWLKDINRKDKYSAVIKEKVKEYEHLRDLSTKTPEEQLKLLALRNYLNKVPSDFAPELVAHFQSLELREIAKNG